MSRDAAIMAQFSASLGQDLEQSQLGEHGNLGNPQVRSRRAVCEGSPKGDQTYDEDEKCQSREGDVQKLGRLGR